MWVMGASANLYINSTFINKNNKLNFSVIYYNAFGKLDFFSIKSVIFSGKGEGSDTEATFGIFSPGHHPMCFPTQSTGTRSPRTG